MLRDQERVAVQGLPMGPSPRALRVHAGCRQVTSSMDLWPLKLKELLWIGQHIALVRGEPTGHSLGFVFLGS